MGLDLPGGGGPPLWQVGTALAAVLALLILVLRCLQRWQPGQRDDARARLLSVQRLGPRRDLQVLRVGDQVHTLYRQEGAMVVLSTVAWADWSRTQSEATASPAWKPRLRSLMAAAGGRAATLATPPEPPRCA